jgi:MFS transporter, DHA2 family, methylenomycin A resistance protein
VSRLLAAALFAAILAPLNSTLLAVLLPAVAADLHVTTSSATWLITGYLVLLGVMQPVGGRLGDRFRRRPLMLGGLTAFGAATLAMALAPSFTVLFGLRLAQAAAGAIVFPNAFALLRDAPPGQGRGLRFGVVGAAVAFAAAGGPVLAGGVVSIAGWRGAVLATLPFVLLAVVLAWQLPHGTAASSSAQRPSTLVAVARRPGIVAAATVMALTSLVMYMAVAGLPIALGQQLRRPAWQTAWLLGVMLLAAAICSPVGGRISDLRGSRVPAALGLCVLAGAVLPMLLQFTAPSLVALALELAGAGAGLGLAMAAIQVSGMEAASGADAGAAAGILATSRYAGGAIGSALVGIGLAASVRPTLAWLVLGSAAVALVAAGSAVRLPRAEPFPTFVGTVRN